MYIPYRCGTACIYVHVVSQEVFYNFKHMDHLLTFISCTCTYVSTLGSFIYTVSKDLTVYACDLSSACFNKHQCPITLISALVCLYAILHTHTHIISTHINSIYIYIYICMCSILICMFFLYMCTDRSSNTHMHSSSNTY